MIDASTGSLRREDNMKKKLLWIIPAVAAVAGSVAWIIKKNRQA